MKILEHKNEKFVIKAEIPIKAVNKNITVARLRKKYQADIAIKHSSTYLFLQYIEPAKFEDINDEVVVINSDADVIVNDSGE